MAKSAPFKSQIGNIYITKSIRPANMNSLYSPLPQQQSPNSGFLINHQSLRSQGKFTQVKKQEPPAITASDCYRLLGANSSAHRPVQVQQHQQQQHPPPHLVITWTDNRHKTKYYDASCYLTRPPPSFDQRRHHQRSPPL